MSILCGPKEPGKGPAVRMAPYGGWMRSATPVSALARRERGHPSLMRFAGKTLIGAVLTPAAVTGGTADMGEKLMRFWRRQESVPKGGRGNVGCGRNQLKPAKKELEGRREVTPDWDMKLRAKLSQPTRASTNHRQHRRTFQAQPVRVDTASTRIRAPRTGRLRLLGHGARAGRAGEGDEIGEDHERQLGQPRRQDRQGPLAIWSRSFEQGCGVDVLHAHQPSQKLKDNLKANAGGVDVAPG